MKRTDKETELAIIEAYKNGGTCRSLGKVFGVSETTIFNILKRYDIEMRTKGGIYELPIDELIFEYKNGVRIIDLAKKYNVQIQTICNYLEKAGVSRDYIYINQSLRRDYFHNIDSYDKAYFLGFMISDGNVMENNRIAMTLQYQDRYILEKFREVTCNENPLAYYPQSRPNEITFHCKSKQMKDDLAQYGVVPRKTFISYIPNWIDPNLMNHLLRGTFDGNGCISYNLTSDKKYWSLSYCAGNYMVVKNFRDWISLSTGARLANIRQDDIHRFSCSWGKLSDIIRICTYLYTDKCDCFLIRKYNKFVALWNYFRKTSMYDKLLNN